MFKIQLRDLEAMQPQESFAILPSFSLGNSIFITSTNTKLLYINMNISWVEHDNDLHNLKNYKIQGTTKIQITKLFSEIEKIWKNNLGLFNLHLKNPIFHFFMNWHKLKTSAGVTFKNPKICYWVGSRHLEQHSKMPT